MHPYWLHRCTQKRAEPVTKPVFFVQLEHQREVALENVSASALDTASHVGDAEMMKRPQSCTAGAVVHQRVNCTASRTMSARSTSSSAGDAFVLERTHKDCTEHTAESYPLVDKQHIAARQASKQPVHVSVLSAINESTKWTVSAAVGGVLIWRHDKYAAWAVVGAVLSSFICKALKHLINQQRPDTAVKSDPGMPSSHANSLNFLSVFAALCLSHSTSRHPVAAMVAAAFTVALGVFLTWLRVYLGYHTWPQVLVGALLGGTTAAGWYGLGNAAALPAIQQSSFGVPALYAAVILATAAFAVKNVMSWAHERRLQQQRKQQQQAQLLQLRQRMRQFQIEAQQQPGEESMLAPVGVTVAAASD